MTNIWSVLGREDRMFLVDEIAKGNKLFDVLNTLRSRHSILACYHLLYDEIDKAKREAMIARQLDDLLYQVLQNDIDEIKELLEKYKEITNTSHIKFKKDDEEVEDE